MTIAYSRVLPRPYPFGTTKLTTIPQLVLLNCRKRQSLFKKRGRTRVSMYWVVTGIWFQHKKVENNRFFLRFQTSKSAGWAKELMISRQNWEGFTLLNQWFWDMRREVLRKNRTLLPSTGIQHKKCMATLTLRNKKSSNLRLSVTVFFGIYSRRKLSSKSSRRTLQNS